MSGECEICGCCTFECTCPPGTAVYPEDRETVLVMNNKNPGVVIRAFFDMKKGLFYPVDSAIGFPVLVTHWTKIPEFFECENS
jgi:hypothetical protein